MRQTATGTCVASIWEDGTEYHSDDFVSMAVEWREIEDHFRQVQDLFGRGVEAVGLFVKCECPEVRHSGTDTTHVQPLENVSTSEGQFALDDDDARLVYELKDSGLLQGIWHTHPNGRRYPSEQDWAGHPHGVPMYIISIESDTEFMVIRFDDGDRPRPDGLTDGES